MRGLGLVAMAVVVGGYAFGRFVPASAVDAVLRVGFDLAQLAV